MADRFDLEQQILDCWRITDDIPMMEAQDANVADMTSLACVYEYKFRQLWATFESMVAEQQFAGSNAVPALTPQEATAIWECIYDHGAGKYRGKASRAQREQAQAILARFQS